MRLLKHLIIIVQVLLFSQISFGDTHNSSQRNPCIAYTAVVNEFFSRYSLPETIRYEGFKFSKKSDGWHIYSYYFLPDSVLKDELFWCRERNKFLDVDFPDADESSSEISKQEYLGNKMDCYNFSILPYFGYAGWSFDMIKDYSNFENPDDTLIECLARAYSAYASELLGDNTGYADRKVKMKFADKTEFLNTDQLSTYRYYQHKASDLYHTLWKRNPDYITFVGDVYNKLSCEYVAAYLALLTRNGPVEAGKELKPGLFDSFISDMYRKHLACCDSNSILITSGDMDTFGTLYLQENEGFRRDVLVINFPLLFSGIYTSHLYKQYPGRQPLKTTLAQQDYISVLRPYVYVNTDLPYLDLDSAFKYIGSTDTLKMSKNAEGFVASIPTDELHVNTDNADIPSSFYKYKNIKLTEKSMLILNLPDPYLYQNDLILLDILNTFHFKRSIYFTSMSDAYRLFDNYLQLEGTNYKLMPVKTVDSINHNFAYDTDVQFQKLVIDSPPYIHSGIQKYFQIQKSFLEFYGSLYSSVAIDLIEKNRNDSAKRLLEHYLQNYISDSSAYNAGLLGIIFAFFELKDFKTATLYSAEITKYFNDVCENYLANMPKYLSEIEDTKLYINYLYSLTNFYIPESETDIRVKKLITKFSGTE